MDRRFIDLELTGYEAELHHRNQTLDIPQAERMRYWLAGWKQSYAAAFDLEYDGPELSEAHCRARIDDLKTYIADREESQDPGTAEIYGNWLKAFIACFEQATGKTLDGEGQEGASDRDVLPTPDEVKAMPWFERKKVIAKLTGTSPGDADQATKIYGAWHAGQAQVTATAAA